MKHLILLLLCASLLSGCAVATAGIEKGDERNFARSLHDVSAERVIAARMKRAYDFSLKHVDAEVAEGVVVLSGNVPTKEDKIEAARIAWSAPNIDQVGNEIMLDEKPGFFRNTKDELLETTIATRLLADKAVKARNFNVETHDGVVYLLGVARTPEELERAAQIAAETRGAEEVISYVRVANLSDKARASEGGTQRELPDFLTTEPPGAEQPRAPIQNAPLDQPIPLNRNATRPQIPYGQGSPTIEGYRTGAIDGIEARPDAEPYYIDPETGEEIPVSYINRLILTQPKN